MGDIKPIKEYKPYDELIDEFNSLPDHLYKTHISFFNENLNDILNIDESVNEHHKAAKIKLYGEYGVSLVGTGYYTKGTKFIEESIQLYLDNVKDLELEIPEKSIFYENLIWHQGLGLYEQKKLAASINVFKTLTTFYPENELYIKWLNKLKRTRIDKVTTPLWSICSIWVIGEFSFFGNLAMNIQKGILAIGITFILIVLAIELYKRTLKPV
jgi:hypothetical protein